jgi:hypothetical protein
VPRCAPCGALERVGLTEAANEDSRTRGSFHRVGATRIAPGVVRSMTRPKPWSRFRPWRRPGISSVREDQEMRGLIPVSLIALGMLVAGLGSADAQSVMKQCGQQWQAAKQAGTTNGETWPQFLRDCRARLASTTSAPPQGGFAPAVPAPAAPAPTPAPAPAQPQTGSLFPWKRPAAPPSTPSGYGAPAPTGAGQFASAQEAQYRCPGATVVWVNTSSHVYHFAGTRNYGTTHHGAYMCEADAQAAGDRAAKNEHHP